MIETGQGMKLNSDCIKCPLLHARMGEDDVKELLTELAFTPFKICQNAIVTDSYIVMRRTERMDKSSLDSEFVQWMYLQYGVKNEHKKSEDNNSLNEQCKDCKYYISSFRWGDGAHCAAHEMHGETTGVLRDGETCEYKKMTEKNNG